MSAEDRPTVDDDDSVSMLEVLAQESRMQEDASAVLGGSDDQDCTYAKGYVKRQALYACVSCVTTEPAAICLACSYSCHEGHQLYELYTKRHFRCDCGNSKFKDFNCQLVPTKADVNEENQYNQNFKGTYCTCCRPYPDPEDETADDMIQCSVCEDWYHGRHLGTDVPENDSYQEMICSGCMARHPFLWAYQVVSSVDTVQNQSAGDEKIDVEGGGGEDGITKPEVGEPTNQQSAVKSDNQEERIKEESGVDSDKAVASLDNGVSENGLKRKGDSDSSFGEGDTGRASSSSSVDAEPPTKKAKTEAEGVVQGEAEDGCLLRDLQKRQVTVKDCAAFWQEGWREKLCSCAACLSMYKEQGVAYLPDTEDTASAYEEKGRSNAQPLSDLEQERSILSGMNRVQQIEMIHGFNDLKSELTDYLKTFVETGKVVGPDDIKIFFEHMEKRKKERLSASAMQYSCK